MTWPSSDPSARQNTSSLLDLAGRSVTGTDGSKRARGRVPMRLVIGVLAALLLLGSATHIGPAIRAGLHDGTTGSWVATTSQCSRAAGCVWHGKFVLPDGRVLLAKADYEGKFPADIHVGTSLPGIYPGGFGLVFPARGSHLWVSMLVGLILGLLGLYWASHRWVAGLIRPRRTSVLGGRVPPT